MKKQVDEVVCTVCGYKEHQSNCVVKDVLEDFDKTWDRAFTEVSL